MDEILNSALWLSIITFILYQLKTLPEVFINWVKRKIIFTVSIYETDELFFHVERWLNNYHSSAYRNISATITERRSEGIGEDLAPQNPKDETGKIRLWQHDDLFIIKYEGKRIFIKKGREKLEAAKDIRSAYLNSFNLSGVSVKKSILNLLDEIVKYNNDLLEKRAPRLFESSHYGDWRSHSDVPFKSMDSVYLDCKEEIIQDIENFQKSEEWYRERAIQYKRGYLLTGEPGNGKTSLCIALANYFHRDLHIMGLNDLFNDNSLRSAFTNVREGGLLVFEDIDAAFAERKSKDEGGISFSALLNCLDGAFYRYGLITIMTTNHPEKLDQALIRTGRIDRHFKIGNPSKKTIESYVINFFPKTDIKRMVFSYENLNLSMSAIQEICINNRNFDSQKIFDLIMRESEAKSAKNQPLKQIERQLVINPS